MKKTLLLVLSVAVFCGCQTQKALLEFNLQTGREYTQEFHNESMVSQEMMGQKVDMSMTVNGRILYHVDSRDGDNYNMTVSYTDMGMKMDMGFMSLEFNSDDQQNEDPMSAVLSSVVGKPFRMVISKRAEIIDVSGFEEILDSMFDSFPEVDNAEFEEFKDQIINSFGEDNMKKNFQMMSAVYPEGGVSKNQKWTVVSDMNSIIPVKTETTYQYKGLRNGNNYIIGNAVVSAGGDESSIADISGMDMTFHINGTMDLEMEIDTGSGWPARSVIRQDIGGHATIDGGGMFPGSMEVPVKIKSTITITGE